MRNLDLKNLLLTFQSNGYLNVNYANLNNDEYEFVFNNTNKPKDLDFNISGTVIEHSASKGEPQTSEKEAHNNTVANAPKATKNSKMRATAKDVELLKSRNASFEKNNPNGSAQFVEGNEDGEVKIAVGQGDTIEKPGTIQIRDNTNGQVNVYQYHKITPEEIAAGEVFGHKISKEQFKEGETYYVLLNAADVTNNREIGKKDHLEIYRLDYSYDPRTDTSHYDLVQDETMDGSNKSSIDYDKRGD